MRNDYPTTSDLLLAGVAIVLLLALALVTPLVLSHPK